MDKFLRLISNISHREPLSDFANLCWQLLQNPIMICDDSFFVLAYSQKEMPDDYVWKEIITKKYSPYIFVEQSDVDGFYQRVRDTRLPMFVDKNAFESENKRVVAAVYDGSSVCGYITVLEYESPITKETMSTIKMITELLSIRFKEDNLASTSIGQYKNDFVASILNGNMNDREMVTTRAAYLSIDFYQYYAVLGFETLDAGFSISYFDQVKNFLLHWFPTCIYQHLENRTYFIVSFSDLSAWKDIQAGELTRYLSHEKLICIMSDYTEDIMKVAYCFRQVKRMEEGYLHRRIGHSSNLIIYAYDMIFSILENLEDQHLEEIIGILEQSDKLQHTEYRHTLEAFFKNNQNISDTAETLHIHRNTAIYRLRKIERLLGLNVDDYRIRLQLELTILKKTMADPALKL
jgi:sugar diacid utilization regulator